MSAGDEFYELLTQRMPDHFVQGWQGRSGDEFARAAARVFETMSARGVEEIRAARILLATFPAKAVGTITVTWDAETDEDYEVLAGSLIARTRWGVEYVLAAPILREASESPGSKSTPVAARWAGIEGNVDAGLVDVFADADQLTFAGGTTDEGRAELVAGIAAGTIRVTDSTAMTGGKLGTLNLIAAMLGAPVAEGETEAQVRGRLRARPRIVTEPAIREAVQAMLGTDDVQAYTGWRDGFIVDESPVDDEAAIMDWLRYAIVVVPAGTDIEAVQALVDRITAFGFYVEVIEGD